MCFTEAWSGEPRAGQLVAGWTLFMHVCINPSGMRPNVLDKTNAHRSAELAEELALVL